MNKKVFISESLMILVTIIWGFGFPITQLALDYGFNEFTILTSRFLIAGIVLTIVYYKKLKYINLKVFKYGGFIGVFLFLGFCFQTMGIAYTTPSKNAFITQLNIIIVPFLWAYILKKNVNFQNIIGVFIATIGLFFLTYDKVGFHGVNIGDIYTFICAIFIAFHVVFSSHYQKKYNLDPTLFVIVSIYIATLLSIIPTMYINDIPKITFSNGWTLLFMGIFNTAFGFLVQSFALKISNPTRISLIVALEGVFGAIGAVLITKEVLTPQIIIGGILIVFSLIITELDIKKKIKKSHVI